ncbi:MAG: hypothetical protein HY554_04470 [Elusimicrobia bacterium]|nr:hypothetical protein [Elusimicrobiota bacterium]
MDHYCAYFDAGFLPRALALYRSLEAHAPSFHLWALALDEGAREALAALRLAHLTPLTLADLERFDGDLLAVKPERAGIDYHLTCTPVLALIVLERRPDIQAITYLDADLLFFSDPSPLLRELANGSVLITPHRFPEGLRHLESCGLFNDGWVTFRRSPEALACLRWWRERCLEWCFNRLEDGRFTEQRYLDEWPRRFPGVVVSRHPGANLAPWNLGRHDVDRREGRVWVDGLPLVFYHFSGFRQINPWLFDLLPEVMQVRPSRAVRRGIYQPYIQALLQALAELATVRPDASIRNGGRSDAHLPAWASWDHSARRLLARQRVLVLGGRIL